MKKSCLLIFCFSLVFHLAKTDDDPEDLCKKLKIELADFKSKLVLQHEQTEYHIEEQRLGKKGKLVVSKGEKIEEIYYQNFQRSTRVAFHDKATKVCTDTTLFSEQTSSEERIYEFFHAESGTFGPTALWAHIKDSLEEFEYEKSTESEGAIRSHICKASNLKLPMLGKSDIRLQISDPEWQVFDQKGVPQLLKLHLAWKAPTGQFEMKIDYLAFEVLHPQSALKSAYYDGEWEESNWIVPSVCFNFHMVKPAIKIADKMRMRLHKVNESSGQVLARYRIVLDRSANFYSYDRLEDRMRATRVISPRKNLFIETEKGQCLYHSLLKFYENDKELNELIDRLYELNEGAFDYVGSQLVRSIRTDVYRYNLLSLNHGRGQDFDIATIYVRPKSGIIQMDGSIDEPVAFRTERFSTSNDLKESILYSIYDFEAIRSDAEYADNFEIDECVVPNTVFSLAAKNDYEGKLAQQDEKQLEQLFRKKLKSLTGENPVNFQKVQLKFSPKEIIASATFRDFENPQMYFFTEDDVILDEKPDETDIVRIGKQTIEECAIESLNNEKSAGFQFCDLENENYCHVIKPADPTVNKLTVRRNDKQCETNRKSVSDEKFRYVTFDEKVGRITTAVRAGELVLNHLEYTFNFTKIHFVREQQDIGQSKLFELEAKGRTFTADATKKTLGISDAVHSLADCFQACQDARKSNFTCDHFSYCKRLDKTYDCNLGSFVDRSSNEGEEVAKGGEIAKDKTSKENREELTKEDRNCALYSVSWLDMFVGQAEKKFARKGVKVVAEIENPQVTSVNCAQYCLDHSGRSTGDKDRCLSFEFCKNDAKASCRLSSTLTRWENEQLLDNDAVCSVYSANHLLNFYPTGRRSLENSITELALSADHCANKCELADCDVFNYCELDSGKFCHYVGAVEGVGRKEDSSGSELFGCVTYQHRRHLLGAPKLKNVELETKYDEKKTGVGFKVSSVVGFSLLALFIGLVAGSAAVSVRRNWKSKPRNTVVSVRFSTLSEDQL